MITKFKRSSRTLFLEKSTQEIERLQKGEKYRLILSPSFYWVKKVDIPVKSVRELLKLLPSLFEDSLPEANYSYKAYKKGDYFIAFAYEDKKILDFLASKDIALSDIDHIYFAQSEFEDCEEAIEIGNDQSIYTKEGIVTTLPTKWFKSVKPLVLAEHTFSKHPVKIQQFSHIVDSRSFYKIGAIVLAFIFILTVEIFLTSGKIRQIEQEKEQLFSKYKLLPTMIQNRSSYKKYLKIHTVATKLRATISLLLSMPLKADEKIELIEFKERKLLVKISGITKKNQSSILSKLKANKMKYKSTFYKGGIRLEVLI